ncbi:hypothetical protein CEXT_344701 [Caerostris extrusa]|uniref:Uncharacterized protein n=1 Tax=Caerostris extrusa TaxID=172846 RepID=A0AAV4P0D2_CAEEX|nr:hypothetical protein CEXT_344701 [Caerostris extrusa]
MADYGHVAFSQSILRERETTGQCNCSSKWSGQPRSFRSVLFPAFFPSPPFLPHHMQPTSRLQRDSFFRKKQLSTYTKGGYSDFLQLSYVK